MSSLRVMAKKGRIQSLKLAGTERYSAVLSQASRDPDTIGVWATSVAEDVVLPSDDGGWDIPEESRNLGTPVVPPYAHMWLEFSYREEKRAVLIERTEGALGDNDLRAKCKRTRANVEDKWNVAIFTAITIDGRVVPVPMISWMFLGEDGLINASAIRTDKALDAEEEAKKALASEVSICHFVAMHALARLNCRNVELRAIPEGKIRPHAPNKVTPACVWHEIVVASVPKIRSTGSNSFGVPDEEKRAYWIRGHYADYRKGGGLFGNPKLRCVFWIPEHRSGNEELGQVIPEYNIQ